MAEGSWLPRCHTILPSQPPLCPGHLSFHAVIMMPQRLQAGEVRERAARRLCSHSLLKRGCHCAPALPEPYRSTACARLPCIHRPHADMQMRADSANIRRLRPTARGHRMPVHELSGRGARERKRFDSCTPCTGLDMGAVAVSGTLRRTRNGSIDGSTLTLIQFASPALRLRR